MRSTSILFLNAIAYDKNLLHQIPVTRAYLILTSPGPVPTGRVTQSTHNPAEKKHFLFNRRYSRCHPEIITQPNLAIAINIYHNRSRKRFHIATARLHCIKLAFVGNRWALQQVREGCSRSAIKCIPFKAFFRHFLF